MQSTVEDNWQQQPADEQLAEVARRLPPIFSTFGFELRLDGHQTRVDLGVGVERAASSYLRDWAIENADEDPQNVASWGGLSRLAAVWAETESILARVPFIFLEFDCAGEERAGAPSIFVAVDHREADFATGAVLTTPVLECVFRKRRLSAVKKDVQRALSLLPNDSRILHLGIMLSRPSCPVRLSVSLPRHGLREYLHAIDSSGAAASALQTISLFESTAALAGLPESAQVDFDVSPARGAFGLTLRPLSPGHWPSLVAQLREQGLCDRNHSEMLLGWTGMQRERMGPFGVPVDLSRYVSHVKVVCDKAGVTAKAYIGATPTLGLLRESVPDIPRQ